MQEVFKNKETFPRRGGGQHLYCIPFFLEEEGGRGWRVPGRRRHDGHDGLWGLRGIKEVAGATGEPIVNSELWTIVIIEM